MVSLAMPNNIIGRIELLRSCIGQGGGKNGGRSATTAHSPILQYHTASLCVIGVVRRIIHLTFQTLRECTTTAAPFIE